MDSRRDLGLSHEADQAEEIRSSKPSQETKIEESLALLGLSTDATTAQINAAYDDKKRTLYLMRSAGQDGKGRLVAENEFVDLATAKDLLLGMINSSQSELPKNSSDNPIKMPVNIHDTLIGEKGFAPASNQEIAENFESSVDVEVIWDKLKNDRQFLGIIAYLIEGDFNKRGSLTKDCINNFYNRFPDLIEFQEQNTIKGEAPIETLLNIIKRDNSPEKYREYLNKVVEFTDLMFPGQ